MDAVDVLLDIDGVVDRGTVGEAALVVGVALHIAHGNEREQGLAAVGFTEGKGRLPGLLESEEGRMGISQYNISHIDLSEVIL